MFQIELSGFRKQFIRWLDDINVRVSSKAGKQRERFIPQSDVAPAQVVQSFDDHKLARNNARRGQRAFGDFSCDTMVCIARKQDGCPVTRVTENQMHNTLRLFGVAVQVVLIVFRGIGWNALPNFVRQALHALDHTFDRWPR